MYKNQLMEENPFFNFDALVTKIELLWNRKQDFKSKEQNEQAIWNALETINDALWQLV